MTRRTLAALLVLSLVLTLTALAIAARAPKEGSVVVFDIQDGTGQFRELPAGRIVTRALSAEGLRGVDFAQLELRDKYVLSPVTKLNEPTPEALEECARPTEAEFALLFVLLDYTYDDKTDVSRIEANVQSLRREGPDGPFETQASLVFEAESPKRPQSRVNERTAQRHALDRLARDAAQWLRTGSSAPGKALPRPPRKKSKMLTYALIGVALLALLAMKKGGGGGARVSSDCDPPDGLTASPAGDGSSSLQWQKPNNPTGGLTLEGYEVWVTLDPTGDRFVGRFDDNVRGAVVPEGVGEGIADRAEFRIRSVCKEPDGTEVVSRWGFFPTIILEGG